MTAPRATFATRFGVLMTMIGVAVGLGNVWRFPYLVGRFGGAAFVLMYVAISLGIGVPGLMAEWALGRETQRGTLGAFERGGLPGGKWIGRALFVVVISATAYYTNVVGWVLYYALGEVASAVGIHLRAAAILPPDHGFAWSSFLLQAACTAVVIFTCAVVLERGLRQGIERTSRWIMPALFAILLVLIARSVTLPGAGRGVAWYIGKFNASDLSPTVIVAAMGQAIFSLSLGGTFMVTYGSYLPRGDDLGAAALWTAVGDTVAGLLAGFVIFPAVFAFGMEPASGPSLLFDTVPRVFAQMPGGPLFGLLFFLGLFGAAYLSDVAAFEVLVAGLTDNSGMSRTRAVRLTAVVVFLVALVPMVNMRVFVPWDLTFGSGMQTLGAFLAVFTAAWCGQRGAMLAQLQRADGRPRLFLMFWLRYLIPVGVLSVGVWWLLTDVFGVIGRV